MHNYIILCGHLWPAKLLQFVSANIEKNAEFGPGVLFAISLIVPAVIVKECAGKVDACAHAYLIDPRDAQWDTSPQIFMARESVWCCG